MYLTPRQQILTYIAADAAMNVSSRVFQIYCTWLFLKATAATHSLTSILLTGWIVSTALLPICGAVAECIRKDRILVMAGIFTIAAAVIAVGTQTVFGIRAQGFHHLLSLILVSILSSAATALLFPLGTPLLPEITKIESEIHFGMRLKSAMFVVNMLLGPTSAGLLIGAFGGSSALILCVASAVIGCLLSVTFSMSFARRTISIAQRALGNSVMQGLRTNIIRLLNIKAERTIAIASMSANMLFVPFIYLILPAKLLGDGFTMLELGIVEVFFGVGVLIASSLVIRACQKFLTEHGIASLGIASLGVALIAFAKTNALASSIALAIVAGAGLTMFNVTVNVRRAVCIPDGYRSSMEATLLFFCTASVPIGLLLANVALARFSPNYTVMIGGQLFLPSVLTIIFSKSLREMLNAGSSVTSPYYKITNKNLFK
ncbi:MFS transporter [Trinickia sp. EG282A]|uniref:MFS transporter n=1 Tax=Trinickia sp. EG282A TaxID=3237013 RepID=UPI0034D3032E